MDDNLQNKLTYIDSICNNTNTSSYKSSSTIKNYINHNNNIKDISNTIVTSNNLSNIRNNFKTFNKLDRIDKLTQKLIVNFLDKEYNKLSKSQDSNSLTKLSYLQINEKKLKTLKFFVNLAFLTISLKYIDIFYRVKYGEFIYTASFIIGLYYINKYFNIFEVQKLLSVYCTQNDFNYERTIQKIKNDYYIKNKESLFSKSELDKYWKEPMAWH